MWKNWLSGILGLWLIVVVLLGFSSTLNKVFFFLTGFGVAVLSFWSASQRSPISSASESEIIPGPSAEYDKHNNSA